MSETHNQLRPVSMADSDKTGVPSHTPSMFGEKSLAEQAIPATTGAVKASDSIIGDEKPDDRSSNRNSTASAADDDDDDFEYPKKWKLTAITIGLCLSVFCMALVSTPSLLSPWNKD